MALIDTAALTDGDDSLTCHRIVAHAAFLTHLTGYRAFGVVAAGLIECRITDASRIRRMRTGVGEQVTGVDRADIPVVTIRGDRAAVGIGTDTAISAEIANLALAALVVRVAAIRDTLDTLISREIADVTLAWTMRVRRATRT